MATTLNAGTATGGAAISADTTGILALQSGSTPTTAVTIDTSQNVGIGTSTPSSKLNVQQSAAADATIKLNNTNAGAYAASVNVDALNLSGSRYNSFYSTNNGTYQWSISGGGADSTMAFNTGSSNTERMRIDSAGTVTINATSLGGSQARFNIQQDCSGSYYAFAINNTAAGTTSYVIQDFYRNSSRTGTITATGTATAYNTSSDYRLKEDVQPMTNALTTVSALKPVTYKWKLDGSNGQGFIAHELAEIVPDAVSGEKDAVETYIDEDGNEQTRPKYQGIDTSFLVATLTAAIQELNAKVDAQAAKIQALKGTT